MNTAATVTVFTVIAIAFLIDGYNELRRFDTSRWVSGPGQKSTSRGSAIIRLCCGTFLLGCAFTVLILSWRP